MTNNTKLCRVVIDPSGDFAGKDFPIGEVSAMLINASWTAGTVIDLPDVGAAPYTTRKMRGLPAGVYEVAADVKGQRLVSVV